MKPYELSDIGGIIGLIDSRSKACGLIPNAGHVLNVKQFLNMQSTQPQFTKQWVLKWNIASVRHKLQ